MLFICSVSNNAVCCLLKMSKTKVKITSGKKKKKKKKQYCVNIIRESTSVAHVTVLSNTFNFASPSQRVWF